ncbi:LysR substrate-binding domain-containing protein [Yokenella regensburgei]|jgi:DNA-binding transcriptional LysR family regulator|uniref:DNA-binding transcriptional LysR family regulator n=1 Tax=Yokenella regensburgei TaxID=158877 RepID=A0AB38FX07_9ENTR|nr:LysR substrate-binding domain-containing protein [Yokenella regensburgei]EHM51645.1 LysR substrate binding domain protein [Yokenella regensburgei ATCC 43003]KAF1370780.1 DNA-binding transcriptional LysR family regulator [Yokenella regensburgei]KFD25223.1 LysR family transcriptional regulator [Yokenella regensburgei ATCC 49455]MDQ4429439.1 LysR substrate-binding domain-containing protein [Yokenella regensburgei]MDR2216914.1 LysR family transcriptional regulator [Yokenella regensburgei]
MKKKIPKSELLVTFEVVARHQSFARAAEELSLTQGALFRQIATLEEFLQVPLFSRCKKKLFLSDAGRHYLPLVRDVLVKLENDTHHIRRFHQKKQSLEIATTPTLSTEWLIPNLQAFSALNDNIVVNITALSCVNDFLHCKSDIAIMRENFCTPWAFVEPLFEEELLPVCSNTFLKDNSKKISVYQLLSEFTLLHQNSRPEGWQEWFGQFNITNPDVNKGPSFDLLSMLITAVRSNLGVALLPKFAIKEDLLQGNLIIPCEAPFFTGNKYIMTWKQESMNSMKVKLFRDWAKNLVE